MKKYIQHPIVQLMTGSTVSQLITLAFMPLISRVYDPSSVGVAGVFTTFATVCIALVNFQYDQALFSTKDNEDIPLLQALNTRIILFSIFIYSCIFLFLKAENFLAFEVLEYRYVFILIPLLFFAGFARVGRVMAVKAGVFKKISAVTLTGSLIGNSVKAFLGYLYNSPLSFLIGDISLQMTLFIGYFKNLFSKNTEEAKASSTIPPITVADLKSVAAKYKEYSTFGQLSIFLDTVAMALPLQFITDLYGATTAGIYIFAFRLANIMNVNLGLAISDVFINKFSEFYRTGQYLELKHLFKKTVQRSLLISIPAALVLMTVPPLIFGFLFGEKWQAGGSYFSILIPWMLAGFIVSPISNSLIILKKQKIKLTYDICILGLLCLVYLLGQYFEFSVKNFLIAISISQVISYIVYYLIIQKQIKDL